MRRLQLLLLTVLLALVLGQQEGLARYANNFYEDLEFVNGSSPGVSLMLHSKDAELDLSKNSPWLRLMVDASSLTVKLSYPQSYKLEAYIYDSNNDKQSLGVVSRTLFNKRGARKSRLKVPISRLRESAVIYFDLYDTNNELVNTYKKRIELTNVSYSNNTLDNILADADCEDESYGECQMKYFFDNVKFETYPSQAMRTIVSREHNGKYTVSLPMTKLRDGVGKKRTQRAYKGGLKLSGTNLGEDIFVDSDGRFGVGGQEQVGFLDIRGGTETIPSIRILQGELLDEPIDGAMEYDGRNLYFTIGSVREALNLGAETVGSIGPVGPAGPAGPAGSFDGGSATINGILSFTNTALLESPKLNGTVLITNNSSAKFNGSILIPAGAANGKVLVSDVNGKASWQLISAVVDVNGALLAVNNLADIASAATARTNLGVAIGSDVQAYDADLDTWAGKTAPSGTVVGTSDTQTLSNKTLLAPVLNGAMQFDGVIALKNQSSAPSATAGYGKVFVNGNVLYFMDNGGTQTNLLSGSGSNGGDLVSTNNLSDVASVSVARTNLGLAIGSDVQAYDADLDTWAGKTAPSGTVVGTSDTQTLTNKTFESPILNGTTTLQGSGLLANRLVRTNASQQLVSETTLIVNGSNVGVGTVNPSANLEVNGTIAFPMSDATNIDAATGIVASKAIMKVQGNGAAQDLTANPQIADGDSDGQMLIVKGLSDTNTIKFDDGDGLNLNDGLSFTLGAKDMIIFIYDATDDEWVEVSRSDK